jgi:hypothetical protein
MDHNHRVLLPRFAPPFVSDSTPEIDNLLASAISAASAAEFAPAREVLGERLAHRLETRAYVTQYTAAV